MPKDQMKHVTSRQRPVSCRFCRTRKLRCSREAPCSNCVSRGVHCELQIPVIHPGNGHIAPDAEIINRLERLEKLLVSQPAGRGENVMQTPVSLSSADPNPQGQRLRSTTLSPNLQDVADDVADDVAWLESLYTGHDFAGMIPSTNIVLKTYPIQHVTRQQTFINQTGPEPTRCIWFPQFSEARTLLEKYLCDVDYLHHVTHVPSLPSVIEGVYAGMQQQSYVKPGHVILLLGIFASATHCWVQRDLDRGLFASAKEANDQVAVWIRALENVLDIAHRSTGVSIEGVQGVIIASFTVANLDGFARRSRSMYSLALLLARDLGLHRIDHPSNAANATTAEAEIGRRVWWYLCACDWAISARFNDGLQGVYTCQLRQMITRKPLNVNDEEVVDGMCLDERPLSRPTVMSYSLQRLRMADISRKIVDRNPLIMAHYDGPSIDEIMDIDTELQTLVNDMPPFFSMTKAELIEIYNLSPAQAADILHQRHTFHFLLYAQRCKLHLPNFTRGFADATYSASRDLCVKSARLVIQCEVDLEKSGLYYNPRYKFAGLLLGVFMATSVLFMDLCMNKSSQQHKTQCEDITAAFRILDQAKEESKPAAKFVDSLMQVLRKHKVAPVKDTQSQHLRTNAEGGVACPVVDAPGISRTIETPLCDGIFGLDEACVSSSTDVLSKGEDLSSYFNQFAAEFEHGFDVGNFDWNEMLSSLGSTFP